jgi:hypothetical protein
MAYLSNLHSEFDSSPDYVKVRIRYTVPVLSCVADPIPGSGPGMKNLDHISESGETIFWVKTKYLNSSMRIRDPG